MEAQETLSEFVEGLQEAYRERQLNTEEQWPPVRGDKLINLQLVEAVKEEGFRAGCHNMAHLMICQTYSNSPWKPVQSQRRQETSEELS